MNFNGIFSKINNIWREFLIGFVFLGLIVFILNYNQGIHTSIDKNMLIKKTASEDMVLSLQFSEELYHMQLEVWEYVHLPSQHRLDALNKHLKTQEVLAGKFFNSNTISKPIEAMKPNFDKLVQLINALSKHISSGSSQNIIEQDLKEMESHLDSSKFMVQIANINLERTKLLEIKSVEIDKMLDNEKMSTVFICFFTLLVTAGFVYIFRGLRSQQLLNRIAIDKLNREAEVNALLLQTSKMASLGEMAGYCP